MESVTRTYCDICKKDITYSGSYGHSDTKGKSVDICTNGRKFRGDKSCEDKFLFERSFLAGDIDFN